jgi:hypothetical protein
LNPKEYFNFKAASSKLNKTLNSNYNTLINQYKRVIKDKNLQISKNNFDPFYGFLVSSDNSTVENLLKEYLQSKKIPGVNLKNNIFEDLKFIENDVIKPLGIKMPKIDTSNSSRTSMFDS